MEKLCAAFAETGYAVISKLLCADELSSLRELMEGLITRHRNGEAQVLAESVSIAQVSRQHPQRNPGVEPAHWEHEPYIIGNLIALEPRLASILACKSIWRAATVLLACRLDELVLHFCNLTRKPAGIGPAVGWHRDAGNSFFASEDGRTLRLLIPLQAMDEHNGGTALIPGSHTRDSTAIDARPCPPVPAGAGLALHSAVLHGGACNRGGRQRDVLVIQFGVRSSVLLSQAQEAAALASRDELLKFCSSELPLV